MIDINLNGEQGNAFYLLSVAKQLSKQLDLNYTEIAKEMTSGDYTNLLEIFTEYFGDYVVLYGGPKC